MSTLVFVLALAYQLAGLWLKTYACFLLLTVVFYGLRRVRHDWPAVGAQTPEEWPHVTVQLPIFNEPYVAQRIVTAVAALDYPRERLHIQVLDDSTDRTATLLPALVQRLRREQGVDITYHHRRDRQGYKAGALAAGLSATESEFIAVFDADFVPRPDWLRRTLPALLAHPELAFVQTRWAHLNRQQNLLTTAQALALDGHFVVEQQARSAMGLWQNFNGSGGLWRRAAILDAGGWSADTVTEDLDLSYRAQLKGWRGAYLDDIEAPAELPPLLASYKQQQRRWAQGSTQTLRKLASALWRSRRPWWHRLYAFFHLGGYAASLPLLALLVLTLPLAGLPAQPWPFNLPDGFALVTLLSPLALFALAQYRLSGRSGLRRLWALPILILLSLGISPTLAGAVLAGLRRRGGVFERTPKQGEAGSLAALLENTARSDLLPEALALVYAGLCLLVIAATGRWDLALLPMLFVVGSGAVLAQELREQRQSRRAPTMSGASRPEPV
ncbi:MAG: glycosyltransferase [Caldilineales bacterium]|nr:glycosyltransferase [Caldilineales bacterium]